MLLIHFCFFGCCAMLGAIIVGAMDTASVVWFRVRFNMLLLHYVSHGTVLLGCPTMRATDQITPQRCEIHCQAEKTQLSTINVMFK